MSISSTNRKAGPYIGDGVATVFPFVFKVFQASDIHVVNTNLANIETVAVIDTEYTATINVDQDANPGGYITMLSPPPSGFRITITSNVPNLQPVTLTNQGGFYPSVINAAIDRATIQVQQLAEQVNRSLKSPISSGMTVDEWFASKVANAGGVNLPLAISEMAVSGFIATLLDDANAATARTTLGAAAAGANSDITSLAGLTTPLSVAQGGTGVTTVAAEAQAVLDAISTTQGAVLYRDASDWVALAPGTSGQVLKTNGAGANPSWGAASSVAAGSALTKNPLVFGSTTSAAHGLGQEPSLIRVVLECITGELEWVTGDRIDMGALNPASYYGVNVYADATNVYLKIYNGIYLFTKTSNSGGLLTAANWRIHCYPYKFV